MLAMFRCENYLVVNEYNENYSLSSFDSIFIFSVFFDRGTGSYPCPPQGWQLEILFIPSQLPFQGPHSFKASIVYWEQVGE
jgi:hypothetical protein